MSNHVTEVSVISKSSGFFLVEIHKKVPCGKITFKKMVKNHEGSAGYRAGPLVHKKKGKNPGSTFSTLFLLKNIQCFVPEIFDPAQLRLAGHNFPGGDPDRFSGIAVSGGGVLVLNGDINS